MRALTVTALNGALLLPLLAVAPSASAYGADRMQLQCDDGRVIERSNGSSWWGVDHDAGYVTEHLLITSSGEVQYEKDYGRKAPDADRSTCTADHFGSIWTVQLVQTR